MLSCSAELLHALGDYLEAHGLTVGTASRADLILALLRINTPEALGEAQELAGCAIRRCPPAVPPWPPKPIQQAPENSEPKVRWVAKDNPCLQSTPAWSRFTRIRVGMTREHLRQRGVTARDLRRWAAHLEIR